MLQSVKSIKSLIVQLQVPDSDLSQKARQIYH